MIDCRNYLKSVYQLFFKINDECFVGTKRELRYTLQMDLNLYIDNNFFERTLNLFKELKLIKKEITSDIKVQVTMGDINFTDTKSVYPGIKINESMLDERLLKVEKIIKEDFKKNVNPLINYQELDYIRKFQEEKRNLCNEVMGKVIHEYFFNIYDKDYGFWVHDLDRNKYINDLEILKTYTKDYFKLKKLKDDDFEKKSKNLKYFYNEVMEKLLSILIKKINLQDYISVNISNVNSSMFLESKINKIVYDKENSIISLYSRGDFYCKINMNVIGIDKENVIIIQDGINTIKILNAITREEKRELDYMADLYERMHTHNVV